MGKGQSATGGGTNAAAAETGPPTNWQGIGQAISGAFQQSATAFPQSSQAQPAFAAMNLAPPPATGNQSALERRLLFMKMLAQRDV